MFFWPVKYRQVRHTQREEHSLTGNVLFAGPMRDPARIWVIEVDVGLEDISEGTTLNEMPDCAEVTVEPAVWCLCQSWRPPILRELEELTVIYRKNLALLPSQGNQLVCLRAGGDKWFLHDDYYFMATS